MISPSRRHLEGLASEGSRVPSLALVLVLVLVLWMCRSCETLASECVGMYACVCACKGVGETQEDPREVP